MKKKFFPLFLKRQQRGRNEGEQFLLRQKEEEIQTLSQDAQWLKRLLSHDFRMPMAIISGYGELLKNGDFSSRQEEIECISKICSNIDYLSTLFQVVLDNNDEGLLRKEKFDLLSCVRETAGYVKTMAQKAGIAISVNSSKESVVFWGNRIVLMRAFFNLIENSLRYMNREGSIVITLEETEREILIIYRDDGEGMEKEEAKRIMELCYQGSNGRTDGRGIGMFLVKKAVEENGGEIEIKTEKGKGMSIYMSFPKNF